MIQPHRNITPDLQAILEKLKTISLYKVILFGSYAYGQPDRESDIDLIVVTNDEFFPQTYQEKSDVYLRVSNVLSEVIQKNPIDLLVYTKPMYEKFLAIRSLFAQEILQHGVVLYESDYARMAGSSQR